MVSLNKRLFLNLSLAILGTLFQNSASAQSDILNFEIKADTLTYPVKLNSDSSNVKKVIFWYSSPGNMSQALDLYLEGPQNTTALIKSAFLTGSPEGMVLQSTGWNSMKLIDSKRKERSTHRFTAPTTAGATTQKAITQIDCSQYTPAQIAQLLASYSALYGVSLTQAELCLGADGSGGDGAIDSKNQSVQYRSFISKDACASKNNSNYLVAIEFDLSGMDPALFTSEVTLAVGVRARTYKGDKASSIKPRSDGKFAPKPLVLMSALGGTGQKIRLFKWNRNKIKSTTQVPIVGWAVYNGHYLVRGLADKVLKGGGKGTFEIRNSTDVYGVCFKLKKQRQVANGYTLN